MQNRTRRFSLLVMSALCLALAGTSAHASLIVDLVGTTASSTKFGAAVNVVNGSGLNDSTIVEAGDPEPASVALVGLGGLVLLSRRRR